MRIGIVTDIHESIEPLQRALAEFGRLGVDRVVNLGDACDVFSPVGRSAEVVALLRQAEAIGVWGNHDIGLCIDVPEPIQCKAAPAVLEYMATMRPHLSLENCRFSHVEPWLDANKAEELWCFDGIPDTPELAARSFAAVPERHLFIGHFHRWLVTTPAGLLSWNGEGPIRLNDAARYLVVIAPVLSGWCATFDTESTELIPIRCGE